MSNFCILRIKKLHTNANVGGAISHHLRTRETDNADPEKMKQNWFFPITDFSDNENYNFEKNANYENRKKAQQRAMAMYKKNLPEKIRKNGVRAVEFMMTVSPEAMQNPDFDVVNYLNTCQQWVCDTFVEKNVFFIAQHFDETTPHVSVLLTPIDENGKLNARKFFGGREKMSALQDMFYEKVGKQFGLERGIKGSRAKHQSIKSYYSKVNEQEQNIDRFINNIVRTLPEKKWMQLDDEYQTEISRFLQKEFLSLKPFLEKSFTAEQSEKRLSDLRQNFDNQVRQKIEQENNQLLEYKKMMTEKTVITDYDGHQITCQNGLADGIKNMAHKYHELNDEYNELVDKWNDFISNPKAMKNQIKKIENTGMSMVD